MMLIILVSIKSFTTSSFPTAGVETTAAERPRQMIDRTNFFSGNRSLDDLMQRKQSKERARKEEKGNEAHRMKSREW